MLSLDKVLLITLSESPSNLFIITARVSACLLSPDNSLETSVLVY